MSRFEVCRRNGLWHVFDTKYYVVANARNTSEEALREARLFNNC